MRHFVVALLILIPIPLTAQPVDSSSSSSSASAFHLFLAKAHEGAPITFDEFPRGTSITNQYADHGIVFGGDDPFLTSDGSNPTSPVLSGSPRFQGAIEGRFVDPDTGEPTVIQSFSLDAGFFDSLGSTRIQWFGPDGDVLGQRTNVGFGIERFDIEGANIARWRFEIIETEPAGFGIDNFSLVPSTNAVLFREKSGDDKDGTWGFFVDQIPGFDHVGLQVSDKVYESHPGYPSATYFSEGGDESVFIVGENGVQQQHSRATFEHDATAPGRSNSPVIDFEAIPIEPSLATAMEAAIATRDSSRFQLINYGDYSTLLPAEQKGGDNTFTCVGLVEWAAETAGHNGSQGFIRNEFESFVYPSRGGLQEAPLLSPQLLNYSMKIGRLVDDADQWVQGLLSNVDFRIIDPLGRSLGVGDDEKNTVEEIPYAFLSGVGDHQQFLIPNPLPGRYRLVIEGRGETADGAIATATTTMEVDEFLGQGEPKTMTVDVPVTAGAPGDVNEDGVLDSDDRDALVARLNSFTERLGDPADLNGDGRIDDEDLRLLEILLAQQEIPPLPPGPFLSAADLPDFRFKAEITAAGNTLTGTQEPQCIGETVCVSGAVPGRSEAFLRVVGPKPNGFLQPTLVKFSTSEVRVWVQQISTGNLRYYELPAVDGSEGRLLELEGLIDRTGFLPAALRSNDLPEATLESMTFTDAVGALGLKVTTEDPPPPIPPGGRLTSAAFPGYRFTVQITAAGNSRLGAKENACLPETLCVSGALPGRSEVFLRVVGPKPNGFLQPTIVRFSTSTLEIWIERPSTGEVRYYRLPGIDTGVGDQSPLNGAIDREGFLP